MNIDAESLVAYCRGFFGYGNPKADWWFVGLEEGGESNIEKRLAIWNAHRRPAVDDLFQVNRELGGYDWFGPSAKQQRTWAMIIRAILVAKDEVVSHDSILSYQRESLGRIKGDAALLELMPLPSRKLSDWPYAATRIEGFGSRREYRHSFRSERVVALKKLIAGCAPAVVVFYGARRTWPTLLDVRPEVSNEDYDVVANGETHFVITHHPGKWGAKSHARFDAVGAYLRSRRKTTR